MLCVLYCGKERQSTQEQINCQKVPSKLCGRGRQSTQEK
jgi:hypothetical protein